MGYKKIPTKDLTRLEWLELRREGIGGSDASVVMGENPYRSILQLWEEKTGRKEITDEGNEYTYCILRLNSAFFSEIQST